MIILIIIATCLTSPVLANLNAQSSSTSAAKTNKNSIILNTANKSDKNIVWWNKLRVYHHNEKQINSRLEPEPVQSNSDVVIHYHGNNKKDDETEIKKLIQLISNKHDKKKWNPDHSKAKQWSHNKWDHSKKEPKKWTIIFHHKNKDKEKKEDNHWDDGKWKPEHHWNNNDWWNKWDHKHDNDNKDDEKSKEWKTVIVHSRGGYDKHDNNDDKHDSDHSFTPSLKKYIEKFDKAKNFWSDTGDDEEESDDHSNDDHAKHWNSKPKSRATVWSYGVEIKN